MKQRLLTGLFVIALGTGFLAQNPINGIINDYSPVTGFECDSSVLLVSGTSGLAAGDLVLLIQMQGSAISKANNSTFGDILSNGSAGNYEFNRVESITAGKVRLRYKITRSYEVSGSLQLVRVPEYADVTAQQSTCQAWDGSTGGVFVIDVSGTLTMQGDIDVSALGFRGGQAVDAATAGNDETNYFYPFNPILSGAKGEGIAIITSNESYGRGKAANAGGGGNAHNAGAGGGGNAGAGGFGGLEYYNIPGQPTLNTNGIGGLKIFESNSLKATMGGGGGAGNVNDSAGESGGNGGGIIIIRANAIQSNDFKLLANGGNVVSPGTNRNDGQGGGGAGGTILLQANNLLDILKAELKGGNGGNCLFNVETQIIGPGGGGGGGKLAANQAFPNLGWDNSGGANGIANQNLSNGAEPGQSGTMIPNALLWPQDTIPLITEIDISFCQGDSIVIGGLAYTLSGTVVDTIVGTGACDSIIIYHLTAHPHIEIFNDIALCPNEPFNFNGVNYFAPGTVSDTLTNEFGCDSIIHYGLLLLPHSEVFIDISLCPNEPFSLNGVDYFAPGSITDALSNEFGCDSIIHYNLLLLTQPTRTETIKFCPGETVLIAGQSYTQPGIVVVTVPASMGCDTIVTYTLSSLLPAPSVVAIQCPIDISIIVDPGMAPTVINYNMPTATSNCPCPDLSLSLTSGPASGGLFPNGITQVCYKAEDACGNSKTCCFKVTVREVQPCDIKVIGCMRYELLSITADAIQNKTYRIKVTNNCANKMIYTAIQLPNAVVAAAPANLSVFTADSGRKYDVRNPNYSPFYSIRFKSTTDSIANGQSDIFEYTLPPQSAPNYIHVTTRLAPQLFFEAHLNTFYCPIGITITHSGNRSEESVLEKQDQLTLFPNPTDGTLWVDMGKWTGKELNYRIFNTQGQQVLANTSAADDGLLRIELPNGIPNGLYFFELLRDNGEKETQRFVLQR